MDAHHRFFTASAVTAAGAASLYGHVDTPLLLVASWDVFALATVALAWLVLATQDPSQARRGARIQDSSQTLLFTVVIAAATASVGAVGLLLGQVKDLPRSQFAAHVALSVAAIVLSWMLVHTLFALRYAHIYYHNAARAKRDEVTGGLMFPGKEKPGYLDFAYFSFVIGMTCQVSDVQITSRRFRRLALLHGLISFAFNTAILAMFVNIIAGLI